MSSQLEVLSNHIHSREGPGDSRLCQLESQVADLKQATAVSVFVAFMAIMVEFLLSCHVLALAAVAAGAPTPARETRVAVLSASLGQFSTPCLL